MKRAAIYFFLLFTGMFFSVTSCAQKKKDAPAVTKVDPTTLEAYEKATFAGGCFWCVEAIFERVEGVKAAVSGYSGGKENNPTYDAVSSGKTSHAEAVEVYFDPEQVSYEVLLEIFFATHDPTTLNRQGPDVGKQYRSAVFYHNDEQKLQVERMISKLEKENAFKKPIVTEVVPYKRFYVAEDYHQDYYEYNPSNPYVVNVTKPKVVKFEKEFERYLK